MTVYCIIDTCILCNIMKIPSKSQQAEMISEQFKDYLGRKYKFILPMTVILETGNHIAQVKQADGRQKRQLAINFKDFVLEALKGRTQQNATFRIVDFPEDGKTATFKEWLSKFPDYAVADIGFGDMTLIEFFQSAINKDKRGRYFIWSIDKDIQNYNNL